MRGDDVSFLAGVIELCRSMASIPEVAYRSNGDGWDSCKTLFLGFDSVFTFIDTLLTILLFLIHNVIP